MPSSIDITADIGEGYGDWSIGNDDALLSVVSSVSIACGFHAGDPRIMDRTVAAAVAAGVAIGAHPGYADLRGFGRREIAADPAEIENDVLYQIGALAAFVRSHGGVLAYVKPHGALYNQAARDEPVARAVARGVRRASPELVLVGLALSNVVRRAAEAEGLPFAAEGFADRAYEADGTLRSRRLPGAVITDPKVAAQQAVSLVRDGAVTAADGTSVPLRADTLCVHGDTPGALAIARAVRAALEDAGISVRPLVR